MREGLATLVTCGILLSLSHGSAADERDKLRKELQTVVRPFVKNYCADCHQGEEPEAMLDLSGYSSLDSIVADMGHWEIVLKRLRAEEMPPEDASVLPDDNLRLKVVDWIDRLRRYEANRNAGDPGPVLARRLSNAEYDYSILDLTGVNIQPTRQFPIDPANQAGFDNSGESLMMSPALLDKYLAAARQVANHLVLLPEGITFAPHPAVVYTDRDKFCTYRIVDFYKQQRTDYADYLIAAWRYLHRLQLGTPDAELEDIARADGLSASYLKLVWSILTDSKTHAGPIAELRQQWRTLPKADGGIETTARARDACESLRDWLAGKREEFNLQPGKLPARGLNRSSQPLILWINRQIAANRRLGRLPEPDGTQGTQQQRAAIQRFCSVFPDAFYLSERGRMFLPPEQRNKGRLLNAGFHLQLGYFRDDAPLYELILNDQQRATLDKLWRELDFVTQAPVRQFSDYVYFERAEKGFLRSDEFAFAREDSDVTSKDKMQRLAHLYKIKAREARVDDRVLREIDSYFEDMSAKIRRLEKEMFDAEETHLEALCALARRAWQRPADGAEMVEVLDFYLTLRDQGLDHEDAVRDTLVSILVSPRFCYRVIPAEAGRQPAALADDVLASRLSYFLWSSIPDAELMNHAADGDLHEPEVLLAQTRRMLQDPRSRRLATEFGGNWLDFRRFETHTGVNRERFSSFTDSLRQAMYEEPIQFFAELIVRDGSVLEFIDARHTFVNAPLAEHYGVAYERDDPSRWIRVDDAERFGRGGLLPMSVFLTKNSPGLRTSPVKRGYWVVRRLLGEHIPAPPPDVPELPEDESKLGDLSLREVLEKHRESKSCAGCHERFDSIGLAFEGFGPIGEVRQRDLGGRPVDTAAVFPDGTAGNGLSGLKRYLMESRQDDFIDNLCRKLLSYALGRSLLLSDESTIQMMKDRSAASDHRFHAMIETIVTSPQFLRSRGRDYATSP